MKVYILMLILTSSPPWRVPWGLKGYTPFMVLYYPPSRSGKIGSRSSCFKSWSAWSYILLHLLVGVDAYSCFSNAYPISSCPIFNKFLILKKTLHRL